MTRLRRAGRPYEYPETIPDNMKGSYCAVDYQGLLLSNCRAAITTPDELDIVTSIDRFGTWHAHVVELDEDGRPRRDPLLTSAGLTVEDALVDLHRKSSIHAEEWIQGTVSPRHHQGFNFRGRSTVVACPFQSSRAVSPDGYDNEFMPPSESITDAATHVNSLAETPRLRSTRGYRGENPPNPASTIGDFYSIPAPPRIVVAGHSPNFRAIPPPPPPTLGVPTDACRINALTPPRSPQISASVSRTPEREVILCIDWPGHGKLNILTTCAMATTALKDAAMHIVRMRHGEFGSVRPEDVTPQALRRLQASVQRVQAQDGEWAVDDGVQDLSSLPIAAAEAPRIEVQVGEFGVPG